MWVINGPFLSHQGSIIQEANLGQQGAISDPQEYNLSYQESISDFRGQG